MPRERVLTQSQLNRALLARQGLLEKYGGTVPRAVERMGGSRPPGDFLPRGLTAGRPDVS